MRRIAATLFSFETAFVLFLFAGRYKEDPRFAWVPVDLTLLFLLLSIAAGTWVLYKRHFRFRIETLQLLGLFGGFLLFCGSTYFWTPSMVYAIEKLGYLWVLTFWSFVACALVISQSTQRLKRFLLVLTVFSSWVVAEALLAALSSGITGQQVYALGTRYLGLGRIIGLGAAVVLMYAISITRKRGLQFLLFGLFLSHIGMLLVIGGRGPLVATVLSLGIPVYYGLGVHFQRGSITMRKYLRPMISIFALAVVAVIFLVPEGALTTIARLQILTSGDVGASAEARVEMYSQAIQIWSENPVWGAGIGSWPVLAGWGDQKMYPHNLVLEVLAEYGIAGLVLLVLPVIYAFWVFGKSQTPANNIFKMTVLVLFANTFINAMLTGDLSDNRILFSMLGLLLYQGEHTESRTVMNEEQVVEGNSQKLSEA